MRLLTIWRGSGGEREAGSGSPSLRPSRAGLARSSSPRMCTMQPGQNIFSSSATLASGNTATRVTSMLEPGMSQSRAWGYILVSFLARPELVVSDLISFNLSTI